MITFYSDKEKAVYDSVGGGEKGEKAVLARREYLIQYQREMREYYRELRHGKYFPRNQKETVTLCTSEDDYN